MAKDIHELKAIPYVSLVIDELNKRGLLIDEWDQIEEVKEICVAILADRLRDIADER